MTQQFTFVYACLTMDIRISGCSGNVFGINYANFWQQNKVTGSRPVDQSTTTHPPCSRSALSSVRWYLHTPGLIRAQSGRWVVTG